MKLTQKQAQSILETANIQMQQVPTYRLGQAIFNLLPKEVSDTIWRTELDFFFWTDEDKVLQVFYDNLVGDE
jgi:hypothetical protein